MMHALTVLATLAAPMAVLAATVEVEEPFSGMGSVTWSQKPVASGLVALTLKAKPSDGCAFSGWLLDGLEPSWPVDSRNPSLSGILVSTGAVVTASFVDSAVDTLQFDFSDALMDLVCGEEVRLVLDIDSISFPTLSFKGLPTGLTYDPKTLTVSGTPTTPCANMVVATGVNGSGYRFSQTFQASVMDLESTRIAGSLVEVVSGEYFHGQFDELFSCEGGRISTSLTGIPPGLTWDPSWDLLYGTPTKTGTYILKAQVRFADGVVAVATARIVVGTPYPREYGVELDSFDGISVGDAFELGDFEIGTNSNGVGIVSVKGLPTGLSVTTRQEDGVMCYDIVGTVREAGLFTVKVEVVDDSGPDLVKVATERDVIVADTPWRYLKVAVSDFSPANSGKVSGGGAISVVSGVSVSAKPAKGFVFAGWRDQDGEAAEVGEWRDYRSQALKYDAGTDFEFMELFALFLPSAYDSEIGILGLDGVDFQFGVDEFLDEEFDVTSLSLPTLTAKGLPAGVEINPSSSGSYRISYNPETAAKAPTPGRYVVTLTAKNASGASAMAEFMLTVANLVDERIAVEYDYGDFTPDEPIDPIDLADAVDFGRGETLSVSGLPKGLVFNKVANDKKGIIANTITGTPTVPGYYTLVFTAKVVVSETTNATGRISRTYETATATSFLTVLPYPLLTLSVDDEALKAGNTVTGGGNFKPGTGVTLKAKAAKGWVFAGWDGLFDVDRPLSLNPSFTLVTDAVDQEITANFVPISEDGLSIFVPAETDAGFAAEFERGVEIAGGDHATLILDIIESVSYPTVKATGLPAGVKFDAKTLLLSGKPTKAGVYYATISAKSAGGYSFTRILRLAVVEPGEDPQTEIVPANAAEVDFSQLDNLVTGTFYAPGEARLAIGRNPATGAFPTKVQVSGVPAGLKASVAAAEDGFVVDFTGTPTKVARCEISVKVTYADKTSLTSKAAVILEDGGSAYLAVESGDEERGTVTGGGVYAAGETVKLAAKPKAKCVFAGWLANDGAGGVLPFAPLMKADGLDFRTSSVSFPFRPGDFLGLASLTAAFAASGEDVAPVVTMSEDVWQIDPETPASLAFAVDSVSLPVLTAKNLPKGVKVDLARGLLVYDPTTAAQSGVYAVTLSAKNQSNLSGGASFAICVANRTCEALPGLLPGIDDYGAVVCGVLFNPSLVDCTPAAGWTMKASGLPAGLKLVQDNLAGTYYISGVPTAKAGYYTVTFTASKKGEKSQVATATLKVESIPDWAVGTFDGAVWTETESGGQNVVGQMSASVTSAGKISGKMLKAGNAWTLSAASLAAVESPKPEGESPSFIATVTAKCGKLIETNAVMITLENGRGKITGWTGSKPTIGWVAWQNLWKSEAWKAYAKPFDSAQTLTLYRVMEESNDVVILDEPPEGGLSFDTFTLKFASSGVVTTAGKFITGHNETTGRPIIYSANCSAILIPEDSETMSRKFVVYLYFTPKTGSFEGRVIELPLEWNGEKFLLSE